MEIEFGFGQIDLGESEDLPSPRHPSPPDMGPKVGSLDPSLLLLLPCSSSPSLSCSLCPLPKIAETRDEAKGVRFHKL